MNNVKTNRLFDDNLMPNKPGVVIYSLFNSNKECIYVGQTATLKNRIYQHIISGKQVDSFTFFECDKESANDVEALTIVENQPLLNKNIPSNNVFCSTVELRNSINKLLFKMEDDLPIDYSALNSKKGLNYIQRSFMDKIKTAIVNTIIDHETEV